MIEPQRRIFTAAASFSIARDNPRTLSCYCLRWNTLSTDRGGYQVRLLPGSATFQTPTLGLFNHDYANVLSTTANGTLTLAPDDIGVKFSMNVAKTTVGNDVLELVQEQFVAGMSFHMMNTPTVRRTVEQGVAIVEVSSFLIDEISVIVNPAFEDTSVGVPAAALATADAPSFASRTAQHLQLQRYRFDAVQL